MAHILIKKLTAFLSSLKLETPLICKKARFPFADRPCKYKLLIAVSGGADSIALISSLAEIRLFLNAELFVVTVNHNIREKYESLGDAQFVVAYCKSLNPPVKVFLSEIIENKVKETSFLRKKGLEEAARFLRYKEFQRVKKICNADYILTAHNKNDYYETVLMRIFQGASPQAVQGISPCKGQYLRPFLSVSRDEIEDYLLSKNISWKEDSTNKTSDYLRNKIRAFLIPELNKCFLGWQKGLDKTLDKIKVQNEFINIEYTKKKEEEKGQWKTEQLGKKISCSFSFFNNLHKILKLQFLQEGFILLNASNRIPYSVFKTFMNINENVNTISAGGFCFEKRQDNLFFYREVINKKQSDLISYLVWIENEGIINTPSGNFKITKKENEFFIQHENKTETILGPFHSPVCIRSRFLGDKISFYITEQKTGEKKLVQKSIKKIINEWNINYEKRTLVPIIEEGGLVKAIYGSVFGKKNWYVHEETK